MKKTHSILIGMIVVGAIVLLVLKNNWGARYPDASKQVSSNSGKQNPADNSNEPESQTSSSRDSSATGSEKPGNLSTPVKLLLGLDEKERNYPELLAAINELESGMSDDDVAALMEMLAFPNDRFPEEMRPIEINAVKNDVLDKLLRQEQLPEGLGLHMVDMAGNADNDPVWRDYCIQFMEPFYSRAAKEGGDRQDINEEFSNSGNAELSAIHDSMFSALDERDSTIAGTSLIGLELLSRTYEEFDRELIVNKATEIALDDEASAASRMTALRLAAMTEGSESAADAARSLAQTGETVLLRSAAIVTLGEVGASEDRELLESYAVAENRQIAAAAKMALEKMDAR